MNPEELRRQRQENEAINTALLMPILNRIERENAAMRAQLDRNQHETAALRQQLASRQGAPGHAAPPAEPDDELARALALSLAEEDDDALVAQALALSLAEGAPPPPFEGAPHALGEGDTPEELEARKEYEELLTAQALGAVECLQIAAAEHGDGKIRIGARLYRRVEHGSAYGGHSNLCFYLAATEGQGPLAVQLKEELAPDATALSRAIGAGIDFAAPATRADTEVVRMYVLRRKTTVVVYNSRAHVATSHWTPGSLGATIYLHTDGRHYQRLVPE
jgi:hypothetical protein